LDVVINEVVSTVRMVDNQSLLDERTLSSIVKAVLAAIEDKTARDGRREAETQVDDDGRGGLGR
jgi:hypothetical protein